MARWRPPQQPGSKYITAAGYARLQAELAGLWNRRREVVQALAAAAAEGDRSENAEYIYRKKELREIDRRIRYLQKRLPELTAVGAAPPDRETVYFGAWVRLEDESGLEREYRIVGPDEFDADARYISMDSPVARALLGKQIEDEVTVQGPMGIVHYIVVAIDYRAEPAQ